MKKIAGVLGVALLGLTGGVQAEAARGIRELGDFGPTARQMMSTECPVRYYTGGAGGPRYRDGAQQRKVELFIASTPMVTAVSRYGRGREGERTVCLMPRAGVEPCALARILQGMLTGSTVKVRVGTLAYEDMCDAKGRPLAVDMVSGTVVEEGHGATPAEGGH